MIRNELTGQRDCNGREIKYGDTVQIITDKVDSLVSRGQKYEVFVGQNGIACIQVGVSLEEVAPSFCEVIVEK